MSERVKMQENIQEKQKINRKNTVASGQSTPCAIQKQKADDDFDRLLRHPRSKKKMNLYAKADLPSMRDEEIMEMMRKEQNREKTDKSVPEDMEAFLQSYQEEFVKMIQKEIREEEERIQKAAEERKRREEEIRRVNRKIGVLTKCYITGCYVHFIPAASDLWGNVSHYIHGHVPGKYQRALKLYESLERCDTVEIYGGRLVAVASSGEVIKIEKIDFDD